MDGYTTKLHITLPKNFLKLVDKAARRQGLSRSAYIRLALLQKMEMKNLFDTEAENRRQARAKAEMEAERLKAIRLDEEDDSPGANDKIFDYI